VQKNSLFNQRCSDVFGLEENYQVLSKDSRYFTSHPDYINPEIVHKIILCYGVQLWKNIQEDIWMVNFYLAYIIIPQITQYQSFGLTLRQVPQFLGILYLDGIQNKTIKRQAVSANNRKSF
jgi:hypothetical protein